MSITLGGLATGLDTNSLISQLLKVERRPLERLQIEKSYQNTRLKAFTEFDTKLKDFLAKAEELETSKELLANDATLSSESYFGATASSTAPKGTYAVEVVSLAKVEKEVSNGYADKDAHDFGTGTLALDVGGSAVSVNIDSTNNSLSGIRDAINAAGAGVSASIINDGDASNPYRLVLTADDAATTISMTTSLAGGTLNDLPLTETQTGSQAHIKVDGIDIYRTSNTVTDAIPGVTLDLVKKNETVGETTTLSVDTDLEAVSGKIDEFIDAYNGIVNFVQAQSDADWGSDSSFRSAKRRMQNLLTTAVGGTGSFQTLSELGLETQKDGTITIDSTKLNEAIQNDLESVEKLFVGESGVEGIATKFKSYLDGMTDSADGILASKKKTTESSVRRIDSQILRQEARLEKREEMLRAQFTAMEQLVSAMNSQGAYLSQQLANISLMGSQS